MQAQDPPADAVAQDGNVEVDEKSDFPTAQPQIGDDPRVVYRNKPVHNLELDHHGPVDKQIDAISTIEPHPLVVDRQRLLADERESR